MLIFPENLQVLVSTQPIDMRKAIDGLTLLVIEQFKMNPQERYLFLFCNRERNKVKGIYWDKNGFVMIYKRLERKKFYIPREYQDNPLSITQEQLSWLLRGFDFMALADSPELVFSHYN